MTTSAISSALLGVASMDGVASTASPVAEIEDFLKLLLVQLENQDPTDPMDTTEFTSQMCSLSQLEQNIVTNDYLEDLSLYNSSVNNSQALSCIGKTVTFETNTFSLSAGAAYDLVFELSSAADQVCLTIFDEDGETVDAIDCGSLSAGTNSVKWNGAGLDDGTYSFKVAALDSAGNDVAAATSVASLVTGVVYRDGIAYLATDNGEVALGNVIEVSQI